MNSFFPRLDGSLRTLRARLRRRFSPGRALRRRTGLLRLGEAAASEWLVARELCMFLSVNAAEVPARRRRNYLATTVRRQAPFAEAGFHAEWVGSRAMVWAWAAGGMLDVEGHAGRAPRRLLPESLFRGEARNGGSELVAMDEGCEGRVWRDGLLVASQWWPAPPGHRAWSDFLRGAGLALAPDVPMVQDAPLRAQPWTAHRAPAWTDVAARHRGTAMAVASGVLALVLAFPLGGALRLIGQTMRVERAIAAEAPGVQKILDAREQADAHLRAIDALLALRPPATQIQLLDAVGRAMPQPEWALLEWRMGDAGSLEVVARMPNADPKALVQAWESSGRFRDVAVDIGRARDEVSIRATIHGAPEPSK